MAFKNKKQKGPMKKLSRKQERKAKRKEKKIKRHEFYTNRRKTPGRTFNTSTRELDNEHIPNRNSNKTLTSEELRKKDQKEQKRIEKEMAKQRNKQLLEANIEEDRVIKQLEKRLGLHKRNAKSLPKGFSTDGLDYLLEICDPDSRKNMLATEQDLGATNDHFEEDFALITEGNKSIGNSKMSNEDSEVPEEDSEVADEDSEVSNEESDVSNKGSEVSHQDSEESGEDSEGNSPEDNCDDDLIKLTEANKIKRKKDNQIEVMNKKVKLSNNDSSASDVDSDIVTDGLKKRVVKANSDGTWEDIYGRLRAKDGSVIVKADANKYIPPALRQKINNMDEEQKQKISRLKRQIKGLLNRLAESNMHSISVQIEDLYMNNSRHDMNDALTDLILESLVSKVITPERLLMEHIVLVTVLHANVGTEVGAHFLLRVIQQFDQQLQLDLKIENKELNNIVSILAQLYNFKIFDSKLMYDIIKKTAKVLNEKTVECILCVLKSVGFVLRKDDPIQLKNLIVDLQKRASEVDQDDARVKFMLDILLAIKNNNVKKIPNYDVSYPEHLKKVMKGFLRKGNYVTQLNISLDDLLKADERGKWWIVGSAWSGTNIGKLKETNNQIQESFSQKLQELAREQHMNTDTRKNIFCIIMSAEDYLDAFEKILHLGLKNQQEREIISVLLHCYLQEKHHNRYYIFLAQKFCEYDRKFQLMIKYSVWDKLKCLQETSSHQISNLAKLLVHLFLEKGLPLSTLKIIQFSELDKITLRFMRQILIGILIHNDEEACLQVFLKVSQVPKLKMFIDSLRLFIHHFLLRNLKSDNIPEEKKLLLENRAKMVEKILVTKGFNS